MNRQEIIAALEAATEGHLADPEWIGPIREAIADLCFQHRDTPAGREYWFTGWWGWQPLSEAPDWLHSIDAARTLLPGGRTFWHLSQYSEPPGTSDCHFTSYKDDGGEPFMVAGEARTPALALLIGALKASEAQP